MSHDKRKSWDKSEVFSLITKWEGFPELWDVKSTLFRNRMKKQNALKELAGLFNTSVDEITRKMHNLRTQFHSELRRMKNKKSDNGSEENYLRSTWEFFDKLKFILCDHGNPLTTDNLNTEDVLQYDDTTGNDIKAERNEIAPEKQTKKRGKKDGPDHDRLFIKATYEMIKTTDDYIQQYDYTTENSDIKTEHNETAPEKQSKKRGKKDEPDHDHLFKKSAYEMNKSSDFKIFGDYVASELRNLRSAENQRKLKLEIQRAILRASEIDIYGSSPPQSYSSQKNTPSTSCASPHESDFYPYEQNAAKSRGMGMCCKIVQ